MRSNSCMLCGAELEPIGIAGLQRHPEVENCRVAFCDAWGVAEDVDQATSDIAEALVKPQTLETGLIEIQLFPPVDEVLVEVFDEYKLPRLGGMSSGRGWSSFSKYQRCPHLWRRSYIDQHKPFLRFESPALAIGTLIHVFLALYYTREMAESPYRGIDLEKLCARLTRQANPIFVAEGWRVFQAYTRYYAFEGIIPMAIEHDLKDPRTGESCRYDMVAFHPESLPGLPAGTYIWEHKSASRFDKDTLDGWGNDGEILGEVALWKRLGLDNYFGPLQGVLINILGKHLVPKFHRTIVSPTSFLIDQHLRDLKHWNGLIQLSKSTGIFPRARNNCIGRYGRCDHWDDCLTGED